MSQDSNNPLKKYFRQPKIYLMLPSKGRYYPQGSIQMTESQELPVYPLTAKDEMMMKTPDALLNGEATIDIIKSCIPNILDPWKMPVIDIDAVMVAIRMATYGEKMSISTKVPVINEDRDYEVNLRDILEYLVTFNYEQYVSLSDDITVEIRPMTYKEFTENAQRTFQEQRIFKLVEDDTIPDDVKAHLGLGPATPSPAPTPSPITHPDVSVTSSYPLRLRYKSGDYVLDPATNQWRTVHGKKVAPELADFLNYQKSKL